MYGLVSVEEKTKGRPVCCGVRWITGVPFYEVTVRESKIGPVRKRRLHRAAELLKRRGVKTVLLPRGFWKNEVFDRCGFQRPADEIMRRACAGEMLLWALERKRISRQNCTAVVVGNRPGRAFSRAVEQVSRSVRYTLVCCGGNFEQVKGRLWEEYGISLRLNPSRTELEQADAVVTFDDCEPIGKKDSIWIPAGKVIRSETFKNGAEEAEYTLPQNLEEKVTGSWERKEMLALLLQAGGIRIEDLKVTEMAQKA